MNQYRALLAGLCVAGALVGCGKPSQEAATPGVAPTELAA